MLSRAIYSGSADLYGQTTAARIGGSMGNQAQTAPLAGIKVIEVGVAMAGLFCSMALGDGGADVIKIERVNEVERVNEGDKTRHWPPYFPGQAGYYFASANRNKRSLAIDLKQPEDVEMLRKLAAAARAWIRC